MPPALSFGGVSNMICLVLLFDVSLLYPPLARAIGMLSHDARRPETFYHPDKVLLPTVEAPCVTRVTLVGCLHLDCGGREESLVGMRSAIKL